MKEQASSDNLTSRYHLIWEMSEERMREPRKYEGDAVTLRIKATPVWRAILMREMID